MKTDFTSEQVDHEQMSHADTAKLFGALLVSGLLAVLAQAQV